MINQSYLIFYMKMQVYIIKTENTKQFLELILCLIIEDKELENI